MPSIARAARRLANGRAVALVIAGAALLAVVVPTGLGAEQAVPANTAQPAITGVPAQGQTLTASEGTWSNAPTSFAYQWLRCPSSGGAADGSAAAASNATELVTATAPGPPNTQPPAITGQAVVGQALTANPGTWTGTGITFTYQWRRCDTAGANCADIAGAAATTYTLVAADAGHTVRVEVTAKNATGQTTLASAQTAVVTSAPAPATGCPTGTGPVDVDDLSPPARLQVDRQQITPSVVTPGTRTIRVRFHVSACGGRSVEGALVYATPTPYQQFTATEQPTAADGWAVLTMRQLRYFPASGQQQLLVVFVRARKSGEDVLAGISTRRLVSFRVNLRG